VTVLGAFFRSLADNAAAKRILAENAIGRRLASRFVAGETLAEALEVARSLANQGMATALAYLGEHVIESDQAEEATAIYVRTATEINRRRLPAYLSPKLTQLGLDMDSGLCRQNLRRILEAASENDVFVRIDMESSRYTESTLHIVEDLHREFPALGTVLQSYLLRTPGDLEGLIEQDIPVRLVKGAYNEPPELAYQTQDKVETSYKRLVERALSSGVRTAIATHNDGLLAHARSYATNHEIPLENYEFQMLYGIRRSEQQRLVAAGFNVRIYLPFGPHWYPYFMRRLGERPANLVFLLKNLLR
jgi:proline dehydrogenase